MSDQESEVLGLAAATLLSKYRKMATFDEFLERLFFVGKAAVAVLLFFVGIPHMVSYLIVWTGVFPLRCTLHSVYIKKNRNLGQFKPTCM